ncbi:hypothetical protein FGIG_02294 [Fasciola gigantica]|uniref:Uncharacterized protein n=1 Tax=Fasciola gigantica TaxID=46835 RepID=A0A504Z4C1_FASGI|nr:hypothetical protein FGIG_02294 [Fasciola gigantica]
MHCGSTFIDKFAVYPTSDLPSRVVPPTFIILK